MMVGLAWEERERDGTAGICVCARVFILDRSARPPVRSVVYAKRYDYVMWRDF